MKRWTSLAVLCLVLIGCGKNTPKATEAASTVHGIIHGYGSNDPSVVLYGCTATIIGPRTAVTVAHCFHPSHAVNGVRTLKVKGREIRTQFYAHPSFNGYDYDVAIGFAEEDFEVQPKRLSSAAQWGYAQIVGFGCTNGSNQRIGYGVQRAGGINLYAYYRNRYMLKGSGYAVACPGDSGGPVFQGGAIMGVISRTDFRSTTFITRLDSPGNRNFIINAAAGHKSPICAVQARGCQPKLYSQEIAQVKAQLAAAKKDNLADDKIENASELLLKSWNDKQKVSRARLVIIDAELKKLEASLKAAVGTAVAPLKTKVAQKKAEQTAKKAEIASQDRSLALESARLKKLTAEVGKSKATVTVLEKRLKALDA